MKVTGVNTIIENIGKLKQEKEADFLDAFQQWATLAQNTSKQNAPWRDRTGNARNSIFGVGVKEDRIRAYHGIGMFYGVFLELSFQGRYRVIWPTMEALKGVLGNMIKKL
jgi:hypothetical protein